MRPTGRLGREAPAAGRGRAGLGAVSEGPEAREARLTPGPCRPEGSVDRRAGVGSFRPFVVWRPRGQGGSGQAVSEPQEEEEGAPALGAASKAEGRF